MGVSRHEASEAQQRITGRKFCTQHQGMATIDGGVDKPIGNKGATRFVCATCASRWKSRSEGKRC